MCEVLKQETKASTKALIYFKHSVNLRERGRWGDPDVDGRIILRWMLRKLEGVVGTGWS
jgi:hypothetical protein